MKTKHLLLPLLIAFLSSCSSAYRTGQTPDDVYYSPAPAPPVEYVTTNNQQDKDTYAYNNTGNNGDLAIGNGLRYPSNISLDFGFGYNPYDYYGSSLFSPYSSYYNPYTYPGVTFYSHNYNYYNYYSPFNSYYYSPIYISNYSSPVSNYSGPRTFNLGVYNNTANRGFSHPGQSITNTAAPVRTFPAQPANNRSGVGNFIRSIFTPSNNSRSYRNGNSSNDYSSPARTQSNSSGGGSSSHSSGSSSASVRSFR
jgi:hypothetical protein